MASDNIAAFPSPDAMTTPDQALIEARERGLTTVLILGYTPEGTLYIRSSGDITRKEGLWIIENARMQVLFGDDDE